MTKHVFVTGGVVSSLGKGITAASLGRLLKARGYKVTMQKMDPYLNVDPGTMSPFQHGEVFVTEDGHEGDLDLGHYERFIDENLNRDSNVTQGSVYQTLINRERHGDFLGGTVQVIPHVTDEIKARIHRLADKTEADVVITEIGGTIGDIESQPFIEAIRQFRKDVGYDNVLLYPCVAAALHRRLARGKDQAHAALGQGAAQPGRLARHHRAAAADHDVDQKICDKIASFCDVDPDDVFVNADCPSIYDVPNLSGRAGLRPQGLRAARPRPPRERHGASGTTSSTAKSAAEASRRARREDQGGRQVHPAARRLPLGHRGAAPRRRAPTGARSTSSSSTARS